MPRKIYFSNKIEKLLDKLRSEIYIVRENIDDIFIKDYIITQTAGMKQWLSVEMARKEHNGVFANFSLANQDSFLKEIYKLVCGKDTEKNTETTKWILFELLGNEFSKNNEFNTVTEYFEGDDLKRLQLAERLVDLFDQYQVYREDMIKAWKKDQLFYPESETEKWQKWIWMKLYANDKLYPKFKMKEEILEAFTDKDTQTKIKKKFPLINFFGNAIYTPFHQEIFEKLAEFISINHFVVFPTEKSIVKEDFENELLQGLGDKYSELVTLLEMDLAVACESEQADDTLLHTVQHLITNNTPVKKAKKINDKLLQDNSIQINAAYTEVREVEMLYNYLVDLKKNKSELKPQDILVLTTDIDLYAPYIKAIFNNADYKIPYKISGVSAGQKESVITALTRILDFKEEDLTSEKVISLLETKCIAARYGFTDTTGIRALVDKANIRFGWEGLPDDETSYVSWEYGLKKLALGYSMLTEELYDLPDKNGSVYPFVDIEGRGGQDIFRLKAFLDHLQIALKAIGVTKTLAEWRKFVIDDVLENMILAENSDKAELALIYRILNRQEAAEELIKDPVKYNVFYNGFRKSLMEEPGDFGFNSGKVTFSSHVPARGLPCQVIAFLGVNSGLFPRKDSLHGFDLTAMEKLAGDRSKKENDKMLFLETMMAARSNLYFSYIGRSVKDNSQIPPSIVLDQLMDYLENISENPGMVRQNILAEHPLHGFSGNYKADDKRLFSYLYGKDTKPNFPENDGDESSEKTEINIRQIIKFFEDPIKWHYEKVMGIRFDEIEGPLEETELFEPDFLEQWQLKMDYMENTMDEADFIQRLKMDGKLQLGEVGQFQFMKIKEETEDLKNRYLEKTGQRSESKQLIDLDLAINTPGKDIQNINLIGNIDHVYDQNELIIYSVSKKYGHREVVRANLRHLFLNASGLNVKTTCLSLKNGEKSWEPLETEEALLIVQEAVTVFLEAADRMFLYFENAKAQIQELDPEEKGEEADKLHSKILELLEKAAYPDTGFPDLYLRQAYDDEIFTEGLGQLKEDTCKMISIIEK